MGAFRVIIVQETETHHHEIVKASPGVRIFVKRCRGTSMHGSFGLTYFVVNLSV